MRRMTGERRIKRLMPARLAFLFFGYLPLMSGNLFGGHPVLVIAFLTAILIMATLCKRIDLTSERVVVARPLLGWLSFLPRLGWLQHEVSAQHPLSELLRAEADGHHVVLIYRSGLAAPALPAVASAKEAEDFADAVNQALAERLEGIVKVSEREAPTLELGPLRPSGPTLRCPYCHDDLAVAVAAACGGCATLHHSECLIEHGKCSILGCGSPQRLAA